MATVYKAYDTSLERERKTLAKLSHPKIVEVIDNGEHEGSAYLNTDIEIMKVIRR